MSVNTIGSAGRNQWGNTYGMSAQQANDQYMRGLGGGIGQNSQGNYARQNTPAGSAFAGGAGYAGGGWGAQQGYPSAGGAGGGAGGSGSASGSGSAGGGAGSGSGQYSTSINTAPVWNQDQMLAGETQRREAVAGQAANQNMALRNSLAAGGFGSNSAAGIGMQERANQQAANMGNQAANQFNEQATLQNRQMQAQTEGARANEGLALAGLAEGGRQANQRATADQAMMLFRALMG